MPNLKEPEQNPVPQQPQAAAIAPGSRVYVAQNEEPSSTDPPHKVEPAHEDHLDSQSRVTVFFCFNIYMYVCLFSVGFNGLLLSWATKWRRRMPLPFPLNPSTPCQKKRRMGKGRQRGGGNWQRRRWLKQDNLRSWRRTQINRKRRNRSRSSWTRTLWTIREVLQHRLDLPDIICFIFNYINISFALT